MTIKKLVCLLLLGVAILVYLYFTKPIQKTEDKTADKVATHNAATKDTTKNVSPVNENVRVMAHYMPWFKRKTTEAGETQWSHWQWYGKGTKHDPDDVLENGQHDIASVYYPLIPPYDSHDPDVIEYHILTAKLAGIEAFMCNWYGPDSFTDQAVALMLPIAEKYDFKIGICLEEKAVYPPYSKCENREQLVTELHRHIDHILTKHADSKAFLTHDGEPLLFVFNSYGDGPVRSNNLTPDEITQARDGLLKHLLIRNQLDAKQFPAADGPYIWCGEQEVRDGYYQQAKEILKTENVTYLAASASPGFDDSGVHGWGNIIRKTDRRGTKEYLDSWQQAIESKMNAVQIVTWNDFEEGTPIEPTVEFEFQFVDQTELQIETLTNRVANLKDNNLGLIIFELRKEFAKATETKRIELNQQLDKFAHEILKDPAGSTREQLELLRSTTSHSIRK